MIFLSGFNIIDPLVKLLGANWLAEITFGSIIIRLLFAVIWGGALGTERSRMQHAAGLRTYIIVCLASAVVMMTNQFLWEQSDFSGDAARLGAQVITGIGFLGAGMIYISSRNQVKGLTTAAGLWACACLGLAIGAGFYTISIFVGILLIIVLSLLPKFEEHFTRTSLIFDVHVEFLNRESMKLFVYYLRDHGFTVISVEHNPAYSGAGLSVYSIVLKSNTKKHVDHKIFIEEFQNLDYVEYIEELY